MHYTIVKPTRCQYKVTAGLRGSTAAKPPDRAPKIAHIPTTQRGKAHANAAACPCGCWNRDPEQTARARLSRRNGMQYVKGAPAQQKSLVPKALLGNAVPEAPLRNMALRYEAHSPGRFRRSTYNNESSCRQVADETSTALVVLKRVQVQSREQSMGPQRAFHHFLTLITLATTIAAGPVFADEEKWAGWDNSPELQSPQPDSKGRSGYWWWPESTGQLNTDKDTRGNRGRIFGPLNKKSWVCCLPPGPQEPSIPPDDNPIVWPGAQSGGSGGGGALLVSMAFQVAKTRPRLPM